MVLKSDKKPNKIGDNRQKDGKFGPGNCANPEGRPEGSFSLVAILKAELQKCPTGQDEKTYAELIIKRMLKEAIEKGDSQQIKLIWNYIEGLPRQPIEMSGKDGGPIPILNYVRNNHSPSQNNGFEQENPSDPGRNGREQDD